MYCYHHPERQAVGQCIECSKTVCPECKVVFDGRIYCNSCIQQKVDGTGGSAIAAGQSGNTSGMGSDAAVPAGLGEFNWGGLLLTWIWGIGNSVWWSFLVFVPYLGALVMPWVLAFKGNEWAWQSRHWDSVEHFKRVQHTWAVWGWALSIVLALFLLVMMVGGVILLVWWIDQSGSSWY
ncbi:MAG: hypothetical protein JXA01_06790 [Dehalococcoidia bacterium]|nr:hypothetical protein [Dehalococcoidia bacterium]